MVLKINNKNYRLTSVCEVTSSGPYVIVDGISPSSSSFSSVSKGNQTSRLLIMFDQSRTARWFEQVIRDGLVLKAAGLVITKTTQWDNNYPFGYQYIYY